MSKSSQSKSPPTFPGSRILSRKLIVCDKIIMNTDVFRQPSPPSSSFSFSFLYRTRKNIAICQNKKFGGKKFLRKWANFFQGSALFINEDTRSSPIQILNHPREGSDPAIYGTSNQPYQPLPPHNLIHHGTRISFIKLPAVCQPRCVQSNSQRHLDCSPTKYKECHEFSEKDRARGISPLPSSI